MLTIVKNLLFISCFTINSVVHGQDFSGTITILNQSAFDYSMFNGVHLHNPSFYVNGSEIWLKTTSLSEAIKVSSENAANMFNAIAAKNPIHGFYSKYDSNTSQYITSIKTGLYIDADKMYDSLVIMNKKLEIINNLVQQTIPSHCSSQKSTSEFIAYLGPSIGLAIIGVTSKFVSLKTISFIFVKYKIGSKASVAGYYVIHKACLGNTHYADMSSNFIQLKVSPVLTELFNEYSSYTGVVILGCIGGMASNSANNWWKSQC